MRANSKDRPPKYIDLGRTKQVNYNISQREDETGEITYDYNYIIVQSFTIPYIVRGLIAVEYTIEDEIALINNYDDDPIKYGQEYENYQIFRSECKSIAKSLIG